MAVQGKKASQPSYSASFIGTDENLEIYCQPCDIEGERLPAHGFCTNCREHLCITCFKLHKKHKFSRNHILLDKENMPKQLHITSSSTHSQQGDDFAKACSKHPKEMIKFFCDVHEELLCSVCVTLQHTGSPCQVNYIPEISDAVVNSKNYDHILINMNRITEHCQKVSEDTKKMTAKSEKSLIDALADIKKFRTEINQSLNALERQAEHAAKALQAENNNNLKTVERYCDDVTKSMKMLSDSIKQLNTSKQRDRLFIELKIAEKMIKRYEEKIHHVTSYNIKEYLLQPNDKLTAVLKKERAIGILTVKTVKQPSATTADHAKSRKGTLQAQIDIKTTTDNKICDITGITVLNQNLLIFTDWNNNNLKMFNIRKLSIIHQIYMHDRTFDITSVTNTELAVTLPRLQLIQFISASSRTLKKKRTFKVDGFCYGISCHQGKLVVTFRFPAKVQIFDINGRLQSTIKGDTIFMNPLYLTACSDSIYVSDSSKKRLTRLNWYGQLVGSYDCMDSPSGITLSENGQVFVCDSSKNMIKELSIDSSERKVLFKNVKKPSAICWCGERKRLYISCHASDAKFDNFIQIYQLS